MAMRLRYLDMCCDPDALLEFVNGPDGGGIWYSEGENIYLTDRVLDYVKKNGSTQGYVLDSGEEYANFNTPYMVYGGELTSYKDGDSNRRSFSIASFTEYQMIKMESDNFSDWQKTMGYDNWRELLLDKNALVEYSSLSGLSNYMEVPDDQMKVLKESIRDIVINASWQMVYAETEAEFENIWEKMVSDCEGLGAQKLIDWATANIENAIKLRDDALK